MDNAPVEQLFQDMRLLLEHGHATAVLAYVDELEKRFSEMIRVPF